MSRGARKEVRKKYPSLNRDLAPHYDKNGSPSCRGRRLNLDGCQKKIPPDRTEWCSQECFDYCRFRTNPGFARSVIFDRDKGVCNDCGLDTERIKRIFEAANNSYMHDKPDWTGQWSYRRMWLWAGCNDILSAMGFITGQSLWQLDHIIELTDGGTDHPINCQTLCVSCHKAKTRMNSMLRGAYRRKKSERTNKKKK